MEGAPPPYEDNSKPSIYPTANNTSAPEYHQQALVAAYQPNMTNPYPPHYSAPPTVQHQHSYPHPGQQQPTYVYINNERIHYGPSPVTVTCPHCHQSTISKLRFSAGLLAWILFGVFLLFGCWMGCCLIPFCMESCQDCEHYCSNCNGFLGMYKRL